MIYLDNAATTRLHPSVLEAMMPYLTDGYGNAGAIYSFGVSARQAVDRAREQVAEFIGAEYPEQVIFTSGGTESNNWVFYNIGLFNTGDRRGVVTTEAEHDSVLESARFLEAKCGYDVFYVGTNRAGGFNTREMKRSIDDTTALTSAMYVNNEVGTINDVEMVGELCKEAGALFHCDAVQAPGCVEIDVKKIGCDFMSLSAHKLHGPKGVGALFVRDRRLLKRLIRGGEAQEFGLRGGTENVPGIVGFGRACELVPDNFKKCVDHVSYREIKKAFHSRLLACLIGNPIGKKIPVKVNADSIKNDGKILNLLFKGVDAESLVLIAGTKGLCISAGSACHSRAQKASHVLISAGMSADEARESIRVSFSDFNTLNDAREGAQLLAKSLLAYTQI